MHLEQILQEIQIFLLSSSMIGVFVTIFLLYSIKSIMHFFPHSTFTLIVELIFEKAYAFFEDILWKKHANILPYILSLFFLLLTVNILWVLWDFIAPIFWITSEGEFALAEYFQTPSSDLSFNLAVAIVSIVLLISLQFIHFWVKKSLYSYFPIYGKGYLSYTPKKGSILSLLLFIPIKLFDVVLSMFLALLDIVGLLAKIISLSFRLYGNMISGGVLLVLLVWAQWSFTQKMTEFMGGINFPVIFPLLLYAQSLLVACIQAMVFSLLVAIFIRVSQLEAS